MTYENVFQVVKPCQNLSPPLSTKKLNDATGGISVADARPASLIIDVKQSIICVLVSFTVFA